MPTVSPARSARGLVLAAWSAFRMGSFILPKKLSPADDTGGSRQKNAAVPANGLRPTRRVHSHRGARPAGKDGGHRRSARPRSRRARLPHSALEEERVQRVRARHLHELDIGTVREILMLADFRR